ncbi:MAG: tetratricopeptide repeat protein [Candidatus Gracilibacteria bacterium]|nr:tetratricopeptide repeat protein [Candidatus Gracilibacteria bacterium]
MDQQYYHLLVQAEELKMRNEHREAIEICQSILVMDLSVVEAYEEIGDNYISLKAYSKAKKALEKALKVNKRSANANYLYGFVFSALHEWEKAIKYLELANDYQPNHPEVLRCLGWGHFCSGFRKKGLAILERALVLAPVDSYVLCDLGICHLNDRNFTRALDLFSRTLEVDPENIKARECMKIAEMFQEGAV